ncbi:MAG: hypothetical protein ACLRTF_04375 [Blautia sp.]
MEKSLLIFGAGQYGMLTKEIALETGNYRKIDFLDDNNKAAVGKLEDYQDFLEHYEEAIVAIGNPEIRRNWLRKIENSGYKIATVVSPKAHVSLTAKIESGCIIEAFANVQTASTVGKGTIVCSNSVLGHNSQVGEVCQIDIGAVVPPRAKVLDGTKVLAGTVYHIEA